MRRANLLELARERGVVPILLLETLLREGWHNPDGAPQVADDRGRVSLAAEQAAYDRPEDVQLEISGCEALFRLAVAAEDLLPPGVDKEGRPAVAIRRKRAHYTRVALERSAVLLDGLPQCALTASALAVGFIEAAGKCGSNRMGRQAALLGEQLAKLCQGPLGALLPPKGSEEWIGLLLDAADAWSMIAQTARGRAESCQDSRERAIMQGLAEGWLLEAGRLQAAVRGYTKGARA